MEDQGKRLLLAVAIAFGLMVVWSWLFPPEKPPEKPPEDQVSDTERAPGTSDSDASPRPATGEAAIDEATPRGEERKLAFDGEAFPTYRAELSSYSGGLTSWQLQRKKYATDGALLDLVLTADNEAWRPLQVRFPGSTHEIPAAAEWQLERTAPTEARLRWASSDLEVVKKLRFLPEDYLLELTVSVQKLSSGDAKQTLAVATYGYQDPDASGGSFATRTDMAWHPACLVGDEGLETVEQEDLAKAPVAFAGAVRWAGFNHSYFLNALAPRNDAGERLRCSVSALAGLRGAMEVAVEYPEITLKAGDPAYERTLTVYLGPKYLDDLERVGSVVGYDPGLGESVDLGWFAVICRPLLWLLKTFFSLVGNWGIAIIMLTIVVQLLTLPWTTKSMRSMKAMAKLRPEIEKLQKKYKDDKQRQQVEMMNLYKAHQVNPLAGCLPMLLQMPIWFALYRALSVAAELYRSPFIPGWLGDLTAPDPYFIMPVLLTGMMFLQTRLQPSPVESAQQKIMMYGMPIMFGGFSLFFPSGLTLYIFTNTVLRSSHQLYLNRKDGAADAAKVAVDGVVEVVDAADAAADDAPEGASEQAHTPDGARVKPGAGPKKKSKKSGGGRKRKKPGNRR